ncbi:hypothetical protein QYM36_005833 [Artemia franciscana]|uniref:Uncharacterized protein n=1 Tax=Artemia franciscana TaxID=6661 RepID=A0AA88LA58_ARTSF|nr:hypothetical protein QYM36_005833 [Artemia franciscana]
MNLPPDPGIVLPVTMHHNVVGFQQHGQLIFVRYPITNQGQPVIFQDMQVNPPASVSSCQGQGHFSPVSGGITNISHFPIVTNYSVPTSNRLQSLQEWNEDFPTLPSSENSEEEMRAVNPLEAEGVISEANTDNPTNTGMKRRNVSPVSQYRNQPQNRNLKRKLNEVQSSINQNPTMLNKESVDMPYSDLLSISVEAQLTEDNQKFPDDFTIAKFLSSIFGKDEFEVNKTRGRLLIHTEKEEIAAKLCTISQIAETKVKVNKRESLTRGIVKDVPLHL